MLIPRGWEGEQGLCCWERCVVLQLRSGQQLATQLNNEHSSIAISTCN
jgi:hypothetical protein